MQKQVLVWVLALACVALAAPTLYADDPPPCERPATWAVNYAIHETPSDPNSPVIYEVALGLSSVDGDCVATAWHVDTIQIQQSDPNGGSGRVWSLDDPEVLTADGLWWVDHANVSNPESAEFVLTPQITGVAPELSPNGNVMRFDLGSSTYEVLPPGAPFAVTAQWNITLEDEGVPSEGTDIPVDVDPPPPT